MLVYPAKLVAAVVVAFVSLGATLWSSVAEPDSYYPRIVAGSAKPTVSMDAKGAVAPGCTGFVGYCANPVGLVECHRIHIRIPDGLPHR